ncbi:Uncharacterised protein [Salmonella enterica]|uniref:Uncharacterized protein n=1 Tax=Salmonella enterica TaxID=28901 RepID=A0A379SEU4_SALER|nr:Uncharacterised protein [Salmonella enterica]
MHRQMGFAGMAVPDGNIHPVGPLCGVLLLFRPAARTVERVHIGAEDSLQPPRTALLHLLLFAGDRVDGSGFSPPSFRFQYRCQLFCKPFSRFSLRQRLLQRPADILQNIQTGKLCHGKGFRVSVLPHVLPVPGNVVPLVFQVRDGAFRRETEQRGHVLVIQWLHGDAP